MDHIKNDGNKERKKYGRTWEMYSHMMREYKEAPMEAIKKYQVLCYNCNLGKYINGGICPHKEDTKTVF